MADFDVFLCHNSADKPEVIKIAEQLRDRGIQPWIDVWELRPGLSWQDILEEQINEIPAAAVFIGSNGLGPWQNMELQAYLRRFAINRHPVIPVLLNTAPKIPQLPIFLEGNTWVDFRLKEPDPLQQLIWGITGKKISKNFPITSRKVPRLLSYLPNRGEQDFKIYQAFKKCLEQSLPHPLVCIVHGDVFQCHYEFLERLQKVSIPRLLGIEPSKIPIQKYPLGWPDRSRSYDDLSKQLKKNLADSVLGKSLSPIEKINKTFCEYPGPVVVHTDLPTEDWRQATDAINKFLVFWQNWPDLMPGQNLIVCLFIKYQIKRQKEFNRFSFKWLFNYLKTLWRNNRYRRIKKRICTQVEALREDDYNRLAIAVLPELPSISRTHVETWAQSEATRKLIGEEMVGKLLRDIGEIFDDWQERTSSDLIPMDDLAKKLRALLNELLAV
jgi:hypothetical protein